MIRHIPDFICHNYEKGCLQGSLHGFTLLFDIADFTAIGMELQKHGKKGAEELSKFLDFIFAEPISIVRRYGGFVSLFAGDAFCAIFPEADLANITSAVQSIRAFFTLHPSYITSVGSFTVLARQTVAYGDIHWQIYKNALQNEYVFFGDPLCELARLASYKDELLFSESASQRIGLSHFDKTEHGFHLITSETLSEHQYLKFPYAPKTLFAFINPRYASEIPQNEIRSAAFCFANMEGIAIPNREGAINSIQSLADKYGGYVNKFDATDKGLLAIILFGLPKSEGNTLHRICDFSLELLKMQPKLALGICFGTVYAGFTGNGEVKEYTALGHKMNLSARLMSKSQPGEIITDENLMKELNRDYLFTYLGTLNLKGIACPLSYYRLGQRLEKVEERSELRFVGREKELEQIRDVIRSNLDNRQNAIIYVSGDPGIGKSRLVEVALSGINLEAIHTAHVSCNAIIRYPLDAIKQIVRSYFGLSPHLTPEAGTACFRSLWQDIANEDKEMHRIESIIASLLSYEWEASVWDVLPPAEKPVQLTDAIIYFFHRQFIANPILIHLNDGQWLDDESRDILQILSNEGISRFVIVSPCRYLDNGAKVDLGLARHLRIDMELGILGEADCFELICSTLGLDSIPIETANLITARSMGNPLFVEQLSFYLQENGLIDNSGALTGEIGHLSSFGISDIVCSRIDKLSEKVRSCLYGASVLGMEFNVMVLSQMLNGNLQDELTAGVSTRIWKDLDELRYIFTHIMIKDIVYQRMMSEKLKELHETAALAMEFVYANRLSEKAEEIALHFEKAGNAAMTAKYLDKAGEWFRGKFAFSKSEQYLSKALDIRQGLFGEEHPETAESLHNLALLYWNLGMYDKAEPLYIKAHGIREKLLGSEHPDTIVNLHHLGIMYWNQGDFERAEALFLQTKKLFEKVMGDDHANIAAACIGLGELYSQQGKFELAEPLFLQGLQLYEKVRDAEHPDIALSLNELAIMYTDQGLYAKAEPLHSRALHIREKVLGEKHPDTAVSLNNLALLYENTEQLELAEPLYLRALEIFATVLGAEHPNTAASLDGLGALCSKQGKYDQAEEFYQRAIAILSKVLGTSHPWTLESSNGLANLYEKMGEPEKAAQIKATT